MRFEKATLPLTLLLALVIVFFGVISVRSIINRPADKPADLALPKVSDEALESVRARSNSGRFDSSLEVTNTRDNPFSTYSGYVAPTTPPVESTTTENATSTSSTGDSTTTSTTATGSTTSSTSAETESEGDKQLPTLPPEVKAIGL